MAEEINESVVPEEVPAQEPQESAEKTFTQDELNTIVQEAKAKAKRAAEKEYKAQLDEAEKLKKMNAEQKAQYEAQKQADRIAELEAQLNRTGLEKEASKMLSEGGLAASEEILGLVVKGTAEETQEAVNGLVVLVNSLADQKVGEMLKGKTPRNVQQASAGAITKEQFDRMGYKDRNELLQSNPELYKQLKG